jgi:nitroimidazol reductase NimA-like FMN-containing flavoprotein (pyridoxamine 5'-phosphate oxidase superfamily)
MGMIVLIVSIQRNPLMIETMQELLRTHDLCVLATTTDGRPHCSLMAYACDDDARHVYMATYRDSAKFRNLLQNPAVSLLVDTRETHGKSQRAETKALTASGVYEPLTDPAETAAVKARLLSAHPQIEAFLRNSAAEIIAIRLTSFLLLEGLTDSTFFELGRDGRPQDS